MKKIFIYFATAMMLASCSSDNAEDVDKPYNPFPDYSGVVATIPDVEFYGDDDAVTRSTLTFNIDKKIMKFNWSSTDAIGVFATTQNGNPIENSNTSQQKWVLDPSVPLQVGENSVTAVCVNADNNVATLQSGAKYVAYSPIVQSDVNCDNIPVSYRGQVQTENVKTGPYYQRTLSNAYMTTYKESEPAASAHLGAYDFLVSDAIGTPNGGAHFVFDRLGSVSRFIIKAPVGSNDVFDAMIFYNAEADFMLEGIMDVKSKTLTPTVTGHGLTLRFEGDSFDFTTEKDDYFYNNEGYIIAYIISAPIALKSLTNPCTLYLLGHRDITKTQFDALSDTKKLSYEKISEDCYRIKTYYKNSAPLSKYDMAKNKVQQWTVKNEAPDEPIKFAAMTVQEWKEETGFDNEGKGTETW